MWTWTNRCIRYNLSNYLYCTYILGITQLMTEKVAQYLGVIFHSLSSMEFGTLPENHTVHPHSRWHSPRKHWRTSAKRSTSRLITKLQIMTNATSFLVIIFEMTIVIFSGSLYKKKLRAPVFTINVTCPFSAPQWLKITTTHHFQELSCIFARRFGNDRAIANQFRM